MSAARPSFGLILANRAVVLGAITAADLISIAQRGEASGAFDALWVGDSLLAKPRLEAVTLLSTLAGATSRLRLGVGCLATFVHRHPVMFAHQWASLDVLSAGRAWLAVCLGGPDEANAAQALEHAVMAVKQNPLPIWIASNPTGLTWKGGASAADAVVERGLRRVARYADGWMTNKVSPGEFRHQWARITAMALEEGRDPAKLGSALYHNLKVNEDRAAGLEASKAFLDTYYSSRFSPAFVEGWTVSGSPQRCIEELRAYFDAGLTHLALRMTSWNQAAQLERFLNEIAPALTS